MPATVNLIPNPSLEASLDHYGTVGAASIERTGVDPIVGEYCLAFETSGASGDGFTLDPVTPQTVGVHTGSLHLLGAGLVELRLVTNPGGIVKGTTPITLTSTYTRYTVSGTVTTGEQVYLQVVATSPTFTSGSADAFQIEAGNTATPYCDGDQYGCYWLSAPNNSISVREVPYPVIAAGHSASHGIMTMYHSGPVHMAASGTSHSSGHFSSTKSNPFGVMDDFAIFAATETDPIFGYAIRGNEGIQSAATGSDWNRIYSHFVTPRNYRSSEEDLGVSASYGEVGIQMNNLPAGKTQYFDQVQVEINDVQGRIPPSPYTSPRELQVIVKPNRLNYVRNSSFTLNTNTWSAAGPLTLTRDTTKGVETTSPASGKMLVTGIGNTYIEQPISALIPGHTYNMSAYVLWEAGINDVWIHMSEANVVVSAVMFLSEGGSIPYGAGGFGDGEYGGTGDPVPPPPTWVRLFFSFVAPYSSDSLRIYPLGDGAAGIGKSAWVDQLLLEDTADVLPGDYFDGSFGVDYLWEGQATPLLTYPATGPDALITNEYTHFNPGDPARLISSTWDCTSGSFFRHNNVGWSGTLDSVAPDVDSVPNTGSNIFRIHTFQATFKDVKVKMSLKNLGIGAGTGDATDGLHIWVRHIDADNLYVASVNRRDNTIVIKKKLAGTYYTIGPDGTPFVWPINTWQNFSVSISGSSVVTITLARDDVVLLSVVDDGTLGGATIPLAAAVGLRGDFTQFEVKDIAVYPVQSGGIPQESRSYYYQDILSKIGVVNDLVARSIPLGITAATPQFAVPYIQ